MRSSVYPSGAARATSWAATMPPALGLFSITSDCPSASLIFGATVRAVGELRPERRHPLRAADLHPAQVVAHQVEQQPERLLAQPSGGRHSSHVIDDERDLHAFERGLQLDQVLCIQVQYQVPIHRL